MASIVCFLRRRAIAVMAVAVFAWVPAAASVHEEALDKVRAATGIENLKDLPNGLVLIGEQRFYGSDGQWELAFDATGRFLDHVSGPLNFTSGYDGELAWEVDWNNTPRAMVLGDRDQILLAAWLGTGQWLLALEETDSVRFSMEREPHFNVYVGGMTGRITVDDAGLPVGVRIDEGFSSWTGTLSEHETFFGITIPTLLEMKSSRGDKLTTRVTGARQNGNAGLFDARMIRPTNWYYDDSVSSRLELKRSPTQHLLVKTTVDGRDAGWFIFDTGAGATAVAKTLVHELRTMTRVGNLAVGGVGGSVQSRLLQAAELTVGPVTLVEPVFVDLDLEFLEGAFGVKLGGVIGYGILSRAVVEFDIGAPSIELFNPESYELHGAEWQRLYLYQRNASVKARFEDHEAVFKLDTGAANSSVIFHAPFVEEMDLLGDRETSSSVVGGVGGTFPAREGVIDWFDLAGERFEKLNVQFATVNDGAFGDRYTAGNIGGQLLQPFILVLDYPNQRIAFKKK